MAATLLKAVVLVVALGGWEVEGSGCKDLLADVDGDGRGDETWRSTVGYFTCDMFRRRGFCEKFGDRGAWPPASPMTARQACCVCGGGRQAPEPLEVQLGPRPFWLVEELDDGELKETLGRCSQGPFKKSDFSIGHRGAPLQFPEHTKESYEAAARMGAGVLECDVTFTKDKELVCRHSQCDLHTSTNILLTPLAAKCSEPFQGAADGKPASAKCCTSDITLAEFRTLQGKMDAANAQAKTVEEYVAGTAGWRTDLYATRGTLMTHKESIALFRKLGVKMTPELKQADGVTMPFEGFTQEDYARKMVAEYVEAGVEPEEVFVQSFHLTDVLFWIKDTPNFGKQAVFLDRRMYTVDGWVETQEGMDELRASGVRYIAPAMPYLVGLDSENRLIESTYTVMAKRAGLKFFTWTLERSGPLATGGGWYYHTVTPVIKKDSDMLVVLDFLAKKVGIKGIFSDWPATVTYYANCVGL